MSDEVLTLEKVLEETGMIARWEARGEARGKKEGKLEGKQEIVDLLKGGKSPEEIIKEHGAE